MSQFLHVVRAHGLEGFLLGNIPCPSQFLVSTIVNGNGKTETVQVPNPKFVIRCKTASEIWSTLEQLFNINSKTRILQLRFLFQSTRK